MELEFESRQLSKFISPTLSAGHLSLPLSQGASREQPPGHDGGMWQPFSFQGSPGQGTAGLSQDSPSALQPLSSWKTPFNRWASSPHSTFHYWWSF